MFFFFFFFLLRTPYLRWACRITPTIAKVNRLYTRIPGVGLTRTPCLLTTVMLCRKYSATKLSQIRSWLVVAASQQKPSSACKLDQQALGGPCGINLEDVRTALGQANVDLPKRHDHSPRQTIRSKPKTNCEADTTPIE